MADIFEIPIEVEDVTFKLRSELEETTFIIRLDWNTRVEKWHISILDSDEVPIITGLPLNIDSDFMDFLQIPALPPGTLMLLDARGLNIEAGVADLFNNLSLLFYRESE